MHRPSSPALHPSKQRSRRPVTKSQLLSFQRQKPRGTLRPRAPREQCPVQLRRQGPVNLWKKGPLGKTSIVLARWTSIAFRATSLTRGSHAPRTPVPSSPLPLSQSQSPPRPYPWSRSRSHSRRHPSSPTPPDPNLTGIQAQWIVLCLLLPVTRHPPQWWWRQSLRAEQLKACGALPREVFQANPNKLVKIDTENLVQWNIRGVKRNFEELKLLLHKTNVPIVALQNCKLGEEQLSLRGYTLLRGDCPAGEAALLINQRVVHTELTLNSPLQLEALK